MSLAESFNALGMGNGFPFCPATIDVVEFEAENDDAGIGLITHWTTLGGYNKIAFDFGTPVTESQIELSLQNAMKLFWGLENVTGEAYHPSSGASVTAVPIATAPKDRVCLSSVGGQVSDNPGPAVAVMTASIIIRRMVAGDTFLGYGILAYPQTTSGLLYTNGIHAGVNYSSGPQHVALWSMATQDPTYGVNHKYAYTIKNGIHFVGYSEGDGGVADATVPVAVSFFGGITARIDDLEFFTYPP